MSVDDAIRAGLPTEQLRARWDLYPEPDRILVRSAYRTGRAAALEEAAKEAARWEVPPEVIDAIRALQATK